MVWGSREKIAVTTNADPHGRYEFFSNCVEWRVSDLGELLREEIEDRLGLG